MARSPGDTINPVMLKQTHSPSLTTPQKVYMKKVFRNTRISGRYTPTYPQERIRLGKTY